MISGSKTVYAHADNFMLIYNKRAAASTPQPKQDSTSQVTHRRSKGLRHNTRPAQDANHTGLKPHGLAMSIIAERAQHFQYGRKDSYE